MLAAVAAEDRATLGSDPSAAAAPYGTRAAFLAGRRARFLARPPPNAGGDTAINPGGPGAEPLGSAAHGGQHLSFSLIFFYRAP